MNSNIGVNKDICTIAWTQMERSYFKAGADVFRNYSFSKESKSQILPVKGDGL